MDRAQQYVDLEMVRGVAAEIDRRHNDNLDADRSTKVDAMSGQIRLHAGGTTEYYDTAEEAIEALRASW